MNHQPLQSTHASSYPRPGPQTEWPLKCLPCVTWQQVTQQLVKKMVNERLLIIAVDG